MMKDFVYDACSLIYLTKINIKEKLPLLGNVIVCPTVKNELIADLERFGDAKALKANLNKKIILERKFKLKEISSYKNLGRGETETIKTCLKSGGVPITDDHQAINHALSLGLRPKTSEIVLLDLLKGNMINYTEFKVFFKNLARIKLLQPDIVSYFKKMAKSIVEDKNNDSKGGE